MIRLYTVIRELGTVQRLRVAETGGAACHRQLMLAVNACTAARMVGKARPPWWRGAVPPTSAEKCDELAFGVRHPEGDAARGKLLAQFVEALHRRGVDEADRAQIDDHPVDRRRGALDRCPQAIAEVFGVEEHDIGVEAEQQQPREGLGIRVVRDAVIARSPGSRPSTASWGAWRWPAARTSDSTTASTTPGSTPSNSTPAVVADRQQALPPAHAEELAESGNVEQAHRRNQDHRRQGRRGHQGQRSVSGNRTSSMAPAATMPTSWVLPPIASLTAVRESARSRGSPGPARRRGWPHPARSAPDWRRSRSGCAGRSSSRSGRRR